MENRNAYRFKSNRISVHLDSIKVQLIDISAQAVKVKILDAFNFKSRGQCLIKIYNNYHTFKYDVISTKVNNCVIIDLIGNDEEKSLLLSDLKKTFNSPDV